MNKKFSLLLILCLLLNLLSFTPRLFAKEELSYSIEIADFSMGVVNDKFLIDAPGFSIYPTFSESAPVKVLFYALPPSVEVTSIRADIISSEDISVNEEKIVKSLSVKLGDRLRKTNLPCLYFEQGKMRKWNFVKVYYAPFVLDDNILRVFEKVNFRIDYKIHSLDSFELSDSTFDTIASKLFTNYETAQNWYKKPMVAKEAEKFDYLIVLSNSSLESAISEFVKYKQETDGFNVKIVSLQQIISVQLKGDSTEERIRNYIKEHYLEWGIKYVLLVGGPRTLPMCYMYPEPNEKRDEDSSTRDVGRTPTDFFYSELDSNWDYDNDELPGEFGEDTDYVEDFYPDVFVGRIPFDDTESIRQTLSNAIKYENSEESFRKSALLAGAMLYYAEEGKRMDGAMVLNFLYENYLKPSNFKVKSMYEKEGTKPSIFDSDISLTNENFIREMKSNKYGLILWNAHGSPQYIARKYWVDTNNNGQVDSGEIKWIDLLTPTDINGYKLAPSIIYAASCETAWPERNSFAKAALLHGASAYIGASRISYGGGTIDPILEGFVKHFTLDNFGIGDALDLSLYEAPCSQESDFVNLYDYNLYGDPSLRVNSSYSTGISLTSYDGNLSISQGKEVTTLVSVKLASGVTASLSYLVDVEGVQCEISKEMLTASEEVNIKIICGKDAPTGDFSLNLRVKNETTGAIYGFPIHIKILESKFSPYDLNQDGRVDGNDFKILEECFGTTKGDTDFNSNADFNGDNIINGIDLILFSFNFGG